MVGIANRRFWLWTLVWLNVFLLFRSERDRHAILWIDAGGMVLFLLALVATRILPDKIWLRGKR